MERDFFAALRSRLAPARVLVSDGTPGTLGEIEVFQGSAKNKACVDAASRAAGTPVHLEHRKTIQKGMNADAHCPQCGGLDFWTNGAGAVLCGACVPPPSPEGCLAELEALVRLHAGRLFRVQFEPDCCWLSYPGWPDAYVAAVFKGCEAMLDADTALRDRLRKLQTDSLKRHNGKSGAKR